MSGLTVLGLLSLSLAGVLCTPTPDQQLELKRCSCPCTPLSNQTVDVKQCSCPCSPLSDQRMALQRGACPMFWYSFNGRCYKYVASHMTWGDAELNCVKEGGNLASVHDLSELNFVRDLMKNFDPKQGWTWIGLTDSNREGGWMWSDGSKVDFNAGWGSLSSASGGSGQNCGEIIVSGSWDDYPCSTLRPSVCASRVVCP